MKIVYYFFIVILLWSGAISQTKIKSINKVDDGLYLMYYDTTSIKDVITKSTIVEFKDFIVLLEMPISYGGIGTKTLKDYAEGGEIVFDTLKKNFPNKPLKYVLSSHWHPHSISSVLPFIKRGITFITTEKNFVKLREFIDSNTFTQYHNYFKFIDSKGWEIKDEMNTIILNKIDKEQHPNIPTEDFLFFYFPKYNYLHTSCMYQRFNSKAKGKEVMSGRTEEVIKYITSKNIFPKYYISTDNFWEEKNGLISGDSLGVIMKNGISASTIEQEILDIPESDLILKTDSVIKYITTNTIPSYLINRAVYLALQSHLLSKALSLAKLQAFVSPSDPNSWDTLGEIYYIMGERQLAKKYETQSKRIDKSFTGGGEETWQKNLEEMNKKWSKSK